MQLKEVRDHLEDYVHAEEIPDNTIELVPVKSNVKKWAAENAYLLIYIVATALLSDIVLIIYFNVTH